MKKTPQPPSKAVKETKSVYRITTRPRTAASKIDLSLPATVFESAQQLARKLNMPLNELYASALKAYVEAHQTDDVTNRLNQVYAVESSELESALVRLQITLLAGEAW
jgi:hypothetical protein